MSEFAKKYTEVVEKVNSLSLRERVIMCSTIVVAIIILVTTFVLEPLWESKLETEESVNALKLETSEESTALTILSIEYSVDPNKKNRSRLRELTHQLRRIEGDILSKSQHLVPARQTAKVLQEMLENQDSLYLSNLEKLAPVVVPIIDEDDSTPGAKATSLASLADAIESTDVEHVKVLLAVVENSDPLLKNISKQNSIYKHGVRMELDGQFLNVLQYIQALEDMDWKVYWKSFHFSSGAYPQGKASFVIETLGFDNGWITVR